MSSSDLDVESEWYIRIFHV